MTQKKYLILKVTLFVFIFLGIFLFGNLYKYKIDENNKYLRVPNNLEIINLGSSHGQYGFRYNNSSKNYNLGSSSQPLYYDLEVLKKYKDNLVKGGVVIIPISVFSFYQGYEFLDLTDRYYSFLDFFQIYKGDKEQFYLKRYFPLLHTGKNSIEILKYFINCIKSRKILDIEMKYPNDLELEEKVKEADTTVARHLGISDKKLNQPVDIGIDKLVEILKFCKENNLEPILLTTPQTYLYNERVGISNYKERIYNNLEIVFSKVGYKVTYLDYSHDKRFENNLDLFFDDDHLNQKGAKKFTEIVLEELSLKN